jgi:hypothetical protein
VCAAKDDAISILASSRNIDGPVPRLAPGDAVAWSVIGHLGEGQQPFALRGDDQSGWVVLP